MLHDLKDGFYLDPIHENDREALLEYLQEYDIYKFTLAIPHPYKEDDANWWIQFNKDFFEKNGVHQNYAIRNEESKLIGCIGFHANWPLTTHKTEVGYWLAKPFWGRGIMKRALDKLCQLAFKEHKLVKLTAHIFSENPQSARVLEKCGFEKEGYLKKHYFKEGKYLDGILFSKLNQNVTE